MRMNEKHKIERHGYRGEGRPLGFSWGGGGCFFSTSTFEARCSSQYFWESLVIFYDRSLIDFFLLAVVMDGKEYAE